jgi:hypothetical protein
MILRRTQCEVYARRKKIAIYLIYTLLPGKRFYLAAEESGGKNNIFYVKKS